MTYQFNIQLKGITNPPVWRRVLVPDTFTFEKFHEVIQAAFGWDDCHFFGFIGKTNKGNFDISIPDDFLDKFSRQKTIDASKTKLKSFFTDRAIQKMCYIYDFGDNWTHIITLEDVLEEQRTKADCVTGNGACPPEDCGGAYGYEEMKAVLTEDPDSPEAQDILDWLGAGEGGTWDPSHFDLEKVKARLVFL